MLFYLNLKIVTEWLVEMAERLKLLGTNHPGGVAINFFIKEEEANKTWFPSPYF
jgi:hypothetical protein